MKKNIVFLILITLLTLPLYSQSDVFRMNEEANMLLLEGSYYKAIEEYRAVLEINPNDVNSIKGLAEAFYYLGELDEAYTQIKKAIIYDKTNITLLGIDAKILIAMGQIEEAKKIFEEINRREPNNIAAYFGFAEIALVTGKYSESTGNYLDILSISPGNKKALLSLLLISDYQSKHEDSEKYLKEALRLYGGDSFVLYIAAMHYLQVGNLNEAEKMIKRSIASDPSFIDSSILYIKLLLFKEDYSLIPDILSPFADEKNNSSVSYSLGKAYEKMGDFPLALRFYADSFKITPDDEISRFALENLIRKTTRFNDPLRSRYAEYYFARAKNLEEKNYSVKALNLCRRGLLIDPYSVTGRFQYANLFAENEFREKYLSELKILPEEEKKKQYLSDLIEIQESLSQNTVSSEWDIDQFLVQKDSYGINLFYFNSFDTLHPSGEEEISQIFRDIVNHTETIFIKNKNFKIDSFSKAFSFSRSKEGICDYFIILNTKETEREFSVSASLYSSYTGTLVKEYVVNTTGNNKIWEALNNLALDLYSNTQKKGHIMRIDFDRGVINLGKFDGLKEGDAFTIIKKGEFVPSRSYIGGTYLKDDELGTFNITAVDENISEGIIKNKDIFNLINFGDIVVQIQESEKDEKGSPEAIPEPEKDENLPLLDMIMNIK